MEIKFCEVHFSSFIHIIVMMLFSFILLMWQIALIWVMPLSAYKFRTFTSFWWIKPFGALSWSPFSLEELFFLKTILSTFFKIYLFLFLAVLGLHCCARAFSSCGERGYSSLRCMGFSLWWLLLLRSTGSRCAGFSSCGTRALERRLSIYSTRA